MKENIRDIGRLFRQGFEGFEKKPPDALWNKIQSSVPSVRPSFFKRNFSLITGGAILVFVVAIWFAIPEKSEQKSAVIVNENKIEKGIDSASLVVNLHEYKEELKISGPQKSTPLKKTQYVSVNKDDSVHPEVEATPEMREIVEKPSLPISKHGSLDVTALKTTKTDSQPIQIKERPDKTAVNPVLPDDEPINDSPVETETEIRSICKGEEVILSASGGMFYRWSNGMSSESIIVFPESNTTITVDITMRDGQVIHKEFSIRILDCSMYIPRAFSPNDDGNNDVFKVRAEGVSNFEMKIFSKWGEVVFDSKDHDLGWDGRIRSSRAPMGIYIYQIRFIDIQNSPRAIFGTLTLLP